MTNIVNLSQWLKTNDIYNLKAINHAERLLAIVDSKESSSISFEQYQAEIAESLRLTPLDNIINSLKTSYKP